MKHTRKLRKLTSAIVAALLVVGMMAGTVFADDATAQTIKITNNTNGNTYSVYQVMTAEKAGVSQADENGNSSNLYKYTVTDAFKDFFALDENGKGVNGYYLDSNNQIFANDSDTALSSDSRWLNTNQTAASALAAALEQYALDKNISAVGTINDTNAKSFAIGYYLVAETASNQNKEATTDDDGNQVLEVASKPVLVNLVEGPAEITAKNDHVKLSKNITGENDTAVDPTKKNDVNIGDSVTFTIQTNLPTYEANVDPKSLSFVLTDTFSAGLTYNDDLAIEGFTAKTDENTEDYDYEAVYDATARTLTITFNPAKLNAAASRAVTAVYSATLNENAVVGTPGNDNDVKLEYNNNTNDAENHKTLEDKTTTYTYGFGVHKVDGTDGSDLEDAKFTLSKSSDGSNPIQFVKTETGEGADKVTVYTKATAEQIDDKSVETTTEIVSVKGKAPTVEGLDEGTYYLTETQAPDSYTVLTQPVEISITASKDSSDQPTGEGTVAIGSGQAANVEDKDGNYKVTDENGNETGAVKQTGNTIELNVRVENVKGISLPETGRNTALYCMVAGIAIAAIGLIYLGFASRRRKED